MKEEIEVKMLCDKYYIISKLLDAKFKYKGTRKIKDFYFYKKDDEKYFIDQDFHNAIILRCSETEDGEIDYKFVKRKNHDTNIMQIQNKNAPQIGGIKTIFKILKNAGYEKFETIETTSNYYENGNRKINIKESGNRDIYLNYIEDNNPENPLNKLKLFLSMINLPLDKTHPPKVSYYPPLEKVK